VVADDELKTVLLLGLPVPLHVRTSEHTDELMREFTFLRAQSDDPEAPSVPARLLDLVDDLSGRYSGFTAGTQAELDTAIDEGKPVVDLEYRVPADVAEACVHLRDSLDAADEFCRQGQHLLTLASPDDVVTYRRWFLDEFVRQVEGADPLPWSAASA
jgi:hypothetical protein